jgi:hypothetical protein
MDIQLIEHRILAFAPFTIRFSETLIRLTGKGKHGEPQQATDN